MTTKPENPPAFPVSTLDGSQNGMTLRDYFAAAALQGLLSAQTNPDVTYETMCGYAYTYADALLAARGSNE